MSTEQMVPRVLGLDTDSHGFHWVSSVPILGSRLGYVHSTHKDVEWRRVELTAAAYDLFQSAHNIDWVYCEEPLALQNGKTTRLLGLAAGAIFGAFVLSSHDANFNWVDSAHWKKEILGRGMPPREFIGPKATRTKLWIIGEVSQNPAFKTEHSDSVDEFDKNWNLYDAWCIKTHGVREIIKHGSS